MQKTLDNLAKAFIGESQARNRYTYYAKIAQKEGYEKIAEVFNLTAEQEKIHAKRIFEHIQELKKHLEFPADEIRVEASMPTVYSDTKNNLKAAISGETYEYESMYPEFAKVAEEEGLGSIAQRLRAIAKAEDHHRERYQKLFDQLEAGTLFKKEKEVFWICRECGYMHFGKEALNKCPSCDHPQAFQELKSEDY